jgi:4-amino-4-deoxy-L-arabinose transferase-like glycosyltransferase
VAVTTAAPASHSTPARDLAWLAVLLAVMAAGALLAPPIFERGEAREALVVRDVVQRGDWVLPRRLGVLASKPPLFHWLGAAASHVIGVSDWSVRLPSVLAAWVMAVATFLLGRRCGGRLVGWLAVGALLCTPDYWRSALEARVDMVFAAAVTASLVAFWAWHEDGGRGARALCWLAAAVATLTKGPVGFVLPVLVVVATLLVERDLRRLRALWSWTPAVAAVGVVALWYATATHLGGQEFVAVQLMRENFDRVTGRGEFADRGTRLRLVSVVLLRLAPWSWLALVDLVRRGRDGGVFLHAWWIVVLAVFTLAVGQRPVYLLPLYPAIAVLAARVLAPYCTLPATRVAAAFVLLDVAMFAGVQIRQHLAFDDDAMPAFAEAVASVVPGDGILRATPGVTEDALLILAWRLGRDVARAPLECGPYYLRPVPSRADARSVDILVAAPHITLVRCHSS